MLRVSVAATKDSNSYYSQLQRAPLSPVSLWLLTLPIAVMLAFLLLLVKRVKEVIACCNLLGIQ